MATVNMTLLSERWLDEVVLLGNLTNMDGDQDNEFVPPAGLGDLAIMELLYFVLNIATILGSFHLYNLRGMVVNAAGSAVDIIGQHEFYQTGISNLRLTTYLSPDPLVWLKEGERIQLVHAELDTNATPTADAQVYVKCVRVRPQEGAPQPIRLVR